MIIFKKQEDLSNYIGKQLKDDKKIGFVPTMGALHEGHLSLVGEALQNNDLAVCSIFVNPTQFNNPDDLRHYPVTIEKDIEKLVATGCHILFMPAVEEVYPSHWKKKHYDLGAIEDLLEGYYRPGHFQGVCQVVDRLLDIIRPDRLYMGQKDFQQCIVVNKLLKLTGKNIELVIVPTVREPDGLAMSSRNLRLDDLQRQQAPIIYKVISKIKAGLEKQSFDELKSLARKQLEEIGFKVDYVEIAHADDLSPAQNGSRPLVALVAASIGNIRLIDNLPLN